MSLKCASQYALVHHKQIVFNIKHLSKDKYVQREMKMFFRNDNLNAHFQFVKAKKLSLKNKTDSYDTAEYRIRPIDIVREKYVQLPCWNELYC